MSTEEKLRVLQGELEGYAENTAMTILIQEKIEELEQRKIADMMFEARRERNKEIVIPNS